MNVKDSKTMLWGAAGGAIALAIVGFSWGGWVTGGTATKREGVAAREAVVKALAPLCVERFRAQADVSTKLAELGKASTWDRASLIEKGGWANAPGGTTADSDVARACAEMLGNPPVPKT